jgi:hypothetical protein
MGGYRYEVNALRVGQVDERLPGESGGTTWTSTSSASNSPATAPAGESAASANGDPSSGTKTERNGRDLRGLTRVS